MEKIHNLQQFHRKNSLLKYSVQTTNHHKRVSSDNSSGGGDKNPPQGKMENPHKIQVRKKRKIAPQEEAEQQVSENDTNNLSLEDMDLEVDIENIHFPDEEQRLQKTQQIAVEIATQEEYFLEEESFTI